LSINRGRPLGSLGRSRRELAENLRGKRTDGNHGGAVHDVLVILIDVDRLQQLIERPKLLHDRRWIRILAAIERAAKAAAVEKCAPTLRGRGYLGTFRPGTQPQPALLLDAGEFVEALANAVVKYADRLIS